MKAELPAAPARRGGPVQYPHLEAPLLGFPMGRGWVTRFLYAERGGPMLQAA